MKDKTSAPLSPTILVTGDFVIDHHIYEGMRRHFGDQKSRGVCVKEELGGAALPHRLLLEIQAQSKATWQSVLSIDEELALQTARQCPTSKADCEDQPFAAYAFWRPYPVQPKSNDTCWRVAEAMGFGGGVPENGTWPWQPAKELPVSPSVLVIADGGIGFRDRLNAAHWRIPVRDWRVRKLAGLTDDAAASVPRWVVLKMSAPAVQGDLWRELSEFYSERLVGVVSASELRRADVRLGRGLSWEQTLEDLHQALGHNSNMQALARCRHLVISFGCEGALWLRRNAESAMTATFLFDARHVEGELDDGTEGSVYGYLSCLTATVAAALAASPAEPEVEGAMRSGLSAMRYLLEHGHGSASENGTGFPAKALAEAALNEKAEATFQARTYRCDNTSCPVRPSWSLLALHEGFAARKSGVPLYGIARRVLIQGPGVLRAPTLRVAGFFTADRGEIEALRSLRLLVGRYLQNRKADKPLSIGVFGPPGAGKSFAVKELAQDLLRDRLGWLEFNLSQFNGVTDLIGALHQVRDKVLEGKVPVAFFDEFDSQNLQWLKYLLAPMQDGKFQEGQISHPVGQCLFVFAGGTSHTFEEFAAKGNVASKGGAEKAAHFISSKGPDFASRLDGKLNVVGPNPRPSAGQTGADIFFPVRRALFIRGNLKCSDTERLVIHSGLATALLEMPSFKHGSRSLTKLLEPFKAIRRERPEVPLTLSSLPPQDQLALHVDLGEFDSLTRRDEEAANILGVDKLAAAVHEFYRRKGIKEKWIKPHHNRAFSKLSVFDQASNCAAARRIPAILALAGLKLVAGSATRKQRAAVNSVLFSQVDVLAEAEHDGWVQWHFDNGWSQADTRDDAHLRLNLLLPYSILNSKEKGKDKDAILHFPDIAQLAGLKIVPIQTKQN